MARLNCNPSLHSPHCATYRTLQHRGGIFECCKLAISQRWYHRHLPKGCRCPGRVAEKRRPGPRHGTVSLTVSIQVCCPLEFLFAMPGWARLLCSPRRILVLSLVLLISTGLSRNPVHELASRSISVSVTTTIARSSSAASAEGHHPWLFVGIKSGNGTAPCSCRCGRAERGWSAGRIV